jgi:hypothetical protein
MLTNQINAQNLNLDTGYLFDRNGKKFDISVIFNWPTNADYDATDDIIGPNLVDFYFGSPDDQTTARYADQFVEKQNKLRSLYTKLVGLSATCPNDTELAEQIDFVKSLIVTLH